MFSQPHFGALLLIATLSALLIPKVASSIPDYYGILGVPRNASPELIFETYLHKMKHSTPQKQVWLTEAFEVLGDRDGRAQYDRLRIEKGIPTTERIMELSNALESQYGDRFLEMIQQERAREFIEIDLIHRSMAETFEALGKNLEDQTLIPTRETERHFVMRQLLIQKIPEFISRRPNYDDVTEYGNALIGRMKFPDHLGYGFLGLALRGGNPFEQWVGPYNQLLGFLRDTPATSQEQFEKAFSRWIDNSLKAEKAGEEWERTAAIWFERYTARFQRTALYLAKKDFANSDWITRGHRILYYTGSISGEESLQLLEESIRTSVQRGSHVYPDPQRFRVDYAPVLERIFQREPNLKRMMAREGGVMGWFHSLISTTGYCKYVLGRLSRMPIRADQLY